MYETALSAPIFIAKPKKGIGVKISGWLLFQKVVIKTFSLIAFSTTCTHVRLKLKTSLALFFYDYSRNMPPVTLGGWGGGETASCNDVHLLAVHFFRILSHLGRRLCSPGTSFAPLGESHRKGTTITTHDNGRTSQLYERIGQRADSLKIILVVVDDLSTKLLLVDEIKPIS